MANQIKYTREMLETAAKSSTSLAGVLRALGYQSYSGAMSAHIRRRLATYQINTAHFTGLKNAKGKKAHNRKNASAVLVEGCHRRPETEMLRRSLLEVGVPHLCQVCGLAPTWNGAPLTLQVDHINGDWSDNRQGNLRFLCPNCHAQQITSVPQLRRPLQPCEKCGTLYRSLGKSRFCNRRCSASSVHPEKAVWPGADELRQRVWAESVEKVAQALGVSGAAVHKRCRRLGIRTPPRGYWAKIQAGSRPPKIMALALSD